MGSLWTWGGEDFGFRSGDDLRTHDGRHMGKFYGEDDFAADGRYLGEVEGDRLIKDVMISGYEDFSEPGDN